MKKFTPILRISTLVFFLLFGIVSVGQVGIGTTGPRTTLDVNGALSLREGTALTLTNGNNNNVSLGTPYSQYRITGPTADFNISGIVPVAASDGQMVTLVNTTTQTMTIRHNITSAAINRFFCPGAKDYVLTGQYATVTLQYNTTNNRWVIINYADTRYGDNIQSVVQISDIGIYAPINAAPFVTMTGMTLTFIPKHSTVYVSFSASGFVTPLINGTSVPTESTAVYFRLQNGTANLAHITSVATDFDDIEGVITGWNAHLSMYPVSVTPGVSTTLRIQWRADTLLGNLYPSTINPIIINAPTGSAFSHRSLTILD